jgi:hypothetical protein
MSEVLHSNQVPSAMASHSVKDFRCTNEFDGKNRTVRSNSKRGQGDGPQNAPFQSDLISS